MAHVKSPITLLATLVATSEMVSFKVTPFGKTGMWSFLVLSYTNK